MTDLEKHWDDLPVGPAPVDAVLREARRTTAAAERRRPAARLRRSLWGVAALGGVAAAFVAGSLTTGTGAPTTLADRGGAGSGAVGSADVVPAAFHGELRAPDSCDDLLQHYVDRGLDLVGPDGWGSPYEYFPTDGDVWADGEAFAEGGLPVPTAPQRATADRAGTTGAFASATGTNVQEAGVDEPDAVKTDGRLLVRLRDAELTTYDVSGAEVEELGRLDLGDLHDGEVLLAGETVVAIGNDGTRAEGHDAYGVPLPAPQTRVLTIGVADPAAPTLERTVDYDARLVAARQHGDDVRVVLSKGLPELPFETGGGDAVQVNRDLVEDTALDDWLPQVAVDGGEPTDLLSCDRVAVPRAEIGLATMAVVGFGAATPHDVSALGLAGEAPMTYESPDHLYLAAGGGSTPSGCWECFSRVATGADDGTTHVYDFALEGTAATYVGAGEVEGHVRDRWSMDESGGVLRVAVGPSSQTADHNAVVTLRAEGDELVEVGRIDGLGVGEDITSVRWFDDLALLVTFREVDPLYAVDLSRPAAPRLVGELKIPGFSSYLHPLGTRRVVGMGDDGSGTAQAGLFDVTDLSDLRRLDVASYPRGSVARAGADPRQFTWLPDRRVVLTVVERDRTGFVSTLRLGGGRLRNELTAVEYGSDVDQVRTVPVASGRVVLVTGEDVEWFDVD